LEIRNFYGLNSNKSVKTAKMSEFSHSVFFFYFPLKSVENKKLKIHWKVTSVPVRVRLAAPNQKERPVPLLFDLVGKARTRTRRKGTVRWTVPATSADTGGYLYFLPTAENANQVRLAAPNQKEGLAPLLFDLVGKARTRTRRKDAARRRKITKLIFLKHFGKHSQICDG
jgi:hypothetical protein